MEFNEGVLRVSAYNEEEESNEPLMRQRVSTPNKEEPESYGSFRSFCP
jgi:hypothetical protein